jgi:hypothetical protein
VFHVFKKLFRDIVIDIDTPTSNPTMSMNVEHGSEVTSEHNDDEVHLDDLSVLEYARLNGLSKDYLSEEMPYYQYEALLKGIPNDLTSDAHLPQFDPLVDINTDERLTVSKDAARHLAYVSQGETPDYINSIILPLLESKEVKSTRVELPLLRADHELDCREFAKKEGFEIELKDIRLPMEDLDIENDEGLEFPAKFMTLGTETMEALQREKMEVTRETLVYIQNALKVNWTEEDQQQLWKSVQTYERVSFLPHPGRTLY